MAGLRPGTTTGIPPETAAHQWKVANADDPLLFIRGSAQPSSRGSSPLTPSPSPLPGARGAMRDFHCSLKTRHPPLAPAGCRFRAVFEVDPPRKIFKIHSPTMAAATPAAFQETLRTQIRETHIAQSPQSPHHVSTATIFSCLARSAAISVTSFFKLNAVQHHCHSARAPSCPRSRNRRMSKQAFITANGISPKC